jgi:histidinol phosphatase-like enzyme (inositol monophosphatase family)
MTSKGSAYKERLDCALALLEKARKIICPLYQSPDLAIERKSDESPVTLADRHTEEMIREGIEKNFPLDGILGEEFGRKKGENEFTWYLDPIDGTETFVCGVPLFGSMIGIEEGHESVVGAVDFPALNETVYAARGQGAWWRTPWRPDLVRAAVSRVSQLSEARFSFTSLDTFVRAAKSTLPFCLQSRVRKDRGWGDCYGHMLVATGRIDLMIDPVTHDWDTVPLKIILEEAGGIFSTLKGEFLSRGGSAVSCNRELFPAVEEVLKIFS